MDQPIYSLQVPIANGVLATTSDISNSSITLTQNGITKGTFTLNQSGSKTIDLTDSNTTYSAGTGLSLSGTTFSVNLNYSSNGDNFKVMNGTGGLYATVPLSDYLPLTGGTITGNLMINEALTVKGVGAITDNYFLITSEDHTNILVPTGGFIDALGNSGALMASNGVSFNSPHNANFSS